MRTVVTLSVILIWLPTNAQPATPVIDAVAEGHHVGNEQKGVDAVKAALSTGGNVNEIDRARWTPLMHAALECRANIAALLIERGADVNARSKTGGSDFVETGQTALLLAAGCFINRRRAELAPERHMPAGYAHYELAAPGKIVRDLLAHGAEAGAADDNGRTPLMMAAMHGWADVANELIKAGADVNAGDHAGRIAMDYADVNDGAMIATLMQHGSKAATGRSGRIACELEKAISYPIIDCIVGPQTIKSYQLQRGLPPSGKLDAATLQALGVKQ
ncbi:MAG: ankyrin repeat domain-containing protein [Acidobacteria bacterium]|nr:ankyrin repeat domain-containing protein [Acidobacteriota bacterium]